MDRSFGPPRLGEVLARHRIRCRNGDTAAVVKAPRLLRRHRTSERLRVWRVLSAPSPVCFWNLANKRSTTDLLHPCLTYNQFCPPKVRSIRDRGGERRPRAPATVFHDEAVAGNSSETVRDQPSRFTVWRLIVFPCVASTLSNVFAAFISFCLEPYPCDPRNPRSLCPLRRSNASTI